MVLQFTTKHFKETPYSVIEYIILLYIEEGFNNKTLIAKELKLSPRTVERIFELFLKDDVITRVSKGFYVLTDKLYP